MLSIEGKEDKCSLINEQGKGSIHVRKQGERKLPDGNTKREKSFVSFEQYNKGFLFRDEGLGSVRATLGTVKGKASKLQDFFTENGKRRHKEEGSLLIRIKKERGIPVTEQGSFQIRKEEEKSFLVREKRKERKEGYMQQEASQKRS